MTPESEQLLTQEIARQWGELVHPADAHGQLKTDQPALVTVRRYDSMALPLSTKETT